MSTVPLVPWLAHRPRRGATVIDTVVLHWHIESDAERLIADLRDRQLSYHYVITPEGVIMKCVPFSAVAFHAGNSYGPHEQARGISAEQDQRHHFVELTTVNEYTIAICLLQDPSTPRTWPKAQLAAAVQLITDLRTTPLPKLTYLTTHAWVAPGQAPELEGLDFVSLAVDCGMSVWTPNP